MTIAERASSPWRGCHAGQHVVIGVPLIVPGSLGLLLDGEPGIGEPCSDLRHAWVVMVVAVGLVPDDLAVHHRKTSLAGRLGGCPHPIVGGELDRQIQPALWAQGLVEALQNRWPILGWDEFHGVYTQHAVELALVGEVLEVVLVGGDLGELGGGIGQQGAGVVDPEQPAHHGDLVAALLPSEHGDEDLATLKVFELRQGRAWLVAANPVYPPIPIERAWVLGRVTTTIRRF